MSVEPSRDLSLFRALSECVEEAALVLDRAGKVLACNGVAEESLGRAPGELVGLALRDFAEGEGGGDPMPALDRARAGERLELLWTHLRADGGRAPVLVRAAPVDGGREDGLVVLLARERPAEPAAPGSRRSLPEVMSDAAMAYLTSGSLARFAHELVEGARELTGAEIGAFVSCEPEGLEILAVSDRGWVGEGGEEGPSGSAPRCLPRGAGLFSEAISSRAPVLINAPGEHPSWSSRVSEACPELRSFLGLPLVAGEDVLGVLAVGNRPGGFGDGDRLSVAALAAEGALALALARAEQARRESEARQARSQRLEVVGRLAGGVAHDFNNLLTVISTYAGFLQEDLASDDPRREDVGAILDAAQRASNLTRQLLAFSRRQALAPRVVDLCAVVRDLEPLLSRLIGEDVEIEIRCAPGTSRVEVDPVQLEQVIVNLCANARDAMPEGGRLTVACANVRLDAGYRDAHPEVSEGDYVRLSVADTGVGMDEETRARVFEPFFTTKGPGKGTGLGLSTVEGVVRQSGGYVSVYSELGVGTEFKIYLPAVQKALTKSELPPPSPTLSGSEGVLLVEDDPAVRAVALRILEEAGYDVAAASDGNEALELAWDEARRFDLLLTDVVMPGPSGRVVADALRQARPELRVLFMSGYTEDAIVQHGVLEAGAVLLHKPFSRRELLAKVREALER